MASIALDFRKGSRPGRKRFPRLPCALAAALLVSGSVLTSAADDRTQALDYLGRGADAYRMGDLAQATRHWSEAIRFCRIAGDTALEAEALARRGEALELLGQLRDAASDLKRAMADAEKVGDAAQLASTAGALGNVYFQEKDLDGARSMLTRSLDLARSKGLQSIIAATSNNLGNLKAATGDSAGARSAYDESIDAARRVGDGQLLVTALTNKARLELRSGDHKEGIATLRQALDRALSLAPSREKVYALLSIGSLAKPPSNPPHGLSEADKASLQVIGYEALQQATRIAEDRGDSRAASLGWGYLAELYEAAGRKDEARRLSERAILLAQKSDAPDLLYRWEWLEGRLAKAAGDRDGAITDYRSAVTALESVRRDIPVEYVDGRSSYRETVGPLYFELADLLLQKSASAGSDPKTVAAILVEARNTVETLKTAEIRDYFKDQCLSAVQEKATTLERTAGASKHTAALYPIILSDRVELLVSFADGLRQFTSRVDEKTLNDTAHRLRLSLETLGKRDYVEPGKRLYDWLIRPLEPELAAHGIDTLVVIPDGVLRTLPFSTLYDGKEFLISKYALATAPGLTLIDPRPIAPQPEHALLAGLSKPVQGYAPLRFVGDELTSLNKMYGGRVLQDEAFRLGAVEQDLKTVPYSIVHIASHGEFDSDPTKTYVLTYDGKLTLDALEGAVKYSEFREQPLELLTLSACRTAAGDDRAALGLAGVAIKAGARSAVASLWFVSDEASAKLIELFYEKLHGGQISKAKAMQEAQLELMKDLRFRHPGYWSPFLVIGNWL